ncbi:uncharacterized protein LOC135204930 isoform X2 [Macrobrachium nipponense]|uniref:uncharacterized protein LOC135204930 isoform X2 n=1 Tax=Macrobrachium nipponense TaxID=159736 RepID=UPI0030C8CC2B
MSTMFGVFLIALLVTCEECGGMAPPVVDPRGGNVFPALGFELCSLIVADQTRVDCIACFAGADSDWLQANDCVAKWLPRNLAICADVSRTGNRDNTDNGNAGGNGGDNGNAGGNGGGNGFDVVAQSKLQNCLRREKNSQIREKDRASVLYKKGGQFLKNVGDSKIIEDGGATMFSCMAQELVLGDKGLRFPLWEHCGSCFTRFQMDPVNEQWHLGQGHKPEPEGEERAARKDGQGEVKAEVKKLENSSRLGERNLVYEYGYVGHDMPYHGIGPFAVDILKGDCIYKKLTETGSLDALLLAILENDYPVPAWIFRQILNNIGSINLPA